MCFKSMLRILNRVLYMVLISPHVVRFSTSEDDHFVRGLSYAATAPDQTMWRG